MPLRQEELGGDIVRCKIDGMSAVVESEFDEDLLSDFCLHM